MQEISTKAGESDVDSTHGKLFDNIASYLPQWTFSCILLPPLSLGPLAPGMTCRRHRFFVTFTLPFVWGYEKCSTAYICIHAQRNVRVGTRCVCETGQLREKVVLHNIIQQDENHTRYQPTET
jgi:hypothetical protein